MKKTDIYLKSLRNLKQIIIDDIEDSLAPDSEIILAEEQDVEECEHELSTYITFTNSGGGNEDVMPYNICRALDQTIYISYVNDDGGTGLITLNEVEAVLDLITILEMIEEHYGTLPLGYTTERI